MDKLQWFKFAPSDWSMGKIRRCPEVTQARFIMLCCLYWNKECELSIEDARIEVDDEHYDVLLKKKVIKEVGVNIFIAFLDEQMLGITELSKSKSKAAKARWDKYNSKQVHSTSNADAMHVHTDAVQNYAEKRREEERREEKDKRREKKGVPPSLDSFISHCKLKAKEKNILLDEDKARNKFEAWLENDWKDLNGKKILNWKVKITSNITYWQKPKEVDNTPQRPIL